MSARAQWHALMTRAGSTAVAPPAVTPGDGPAPWATDVFKTTGVFHSSQSRSDHESLENSVGRTFPFALRFLTGGWAGSGRPTTWTTTIGAFESVLNPSSDWWSNRPDITMIVTIPLLVGTQSYSAAMTDPAGDAAWRGFGEWCRDKGFLTTHADGRPKVILRPGHEADGGWYPWGMQFQGRTIPQSVGPFCDLFDRRREQFEAGAGTNANRVKWAYNIMCAHRGNAGRDALAARVPDGCDFFTQDSYDTMVGDQFYGTASNRKNQAQKDAAYSAVRNRILNGNTGRNWGVSVAEAHGKLYALDETGPFFEQYAGQRHDVGGDHFSPISWFADELAWFQSANGPFTKGILGYHVIFNSVASGDEGSTQFHPAQSYSTRSNAAWLAAYGS